MTVSPASNKSVKWTRTLIRALIGGLLSAFVAGIALFLVNFVNPESFMYLRILELPGSLLYTLSGYSQVRYSLDDKTYLLPTLLLALVYWFFFGFGLTYFIKNNKMAIGCWLVLVIIPGVVLLAFFYSLKGIFN